MSKKSKAVLGQPSQPTSYTVTLSDDQMVQLEQWCRARDHLWSPVLVPYSRFGFRGNQVNLVAYNTGKLVIQGNKTADFVTYTLEPEITKQVYLGYEAVLHPEWLEPHAGLDESGKGDVFGPIVSACVIADGEMVEGWMQLGIKDSKKITTIAAIVQYAKKIRQTPGVVIATTFMSMQKYNTLYVERGSNMNFMLGWMHAQSLRKALEQRPVAWGLLDQFSKQPLVQRYLNAPEFDLRMRPRAEDDPVVAAASIIARSVYLEQLDQLSQQAGMPLQKGAGANTQHQLKVLLNQVGPQGLARFAKMHFRTVQQAMGLEPTLQTLNQTHL